MSNLRRIVPSNLRPAALDLTPERVDRFVSLLDALAARPVNPIPQDASIATSGRTVGDVHAPLVAAEEAGRDIASEISA